MYRSNDVLVGSRFLLISAILIWFVTKASQHLFQFYFTFFLTLICVNDSHRDFHLGIDFDIYAWKFSIWAVKVWGIDCDWLLADKYLRKIIYVKFMLVLKYGWMSLRQFKFYIIFLLWCGHSFHVIFAVLFYYFLCLWSMTTNRIEMPLNSVRFFMILGILKSLLIPH